MCEGADEGSADCMATLLLHHRCRCRLPCPFADLRRNSICRGLRSRHPNQNCVWTPCRVSLSAVWKGSSDSGRHASLSCRQLAPGKGTAAREHGRAQGTAPPCPSLRMVLLRKKCGEGFSRSAFVSPSTFIC